VAGAIDITLQTFVTCKRSLQQSDMPPKQILASQTRKQTANEHTPHHALPSKTHEGGLDTQQAHIDHMHAAANQQQIKEKGGCA
jgi:hypothetical protein